ncbi:MAG TPA: TolC family protein [Candidatus Binatia bacterium]|nr:TolC family protein [Candidatus Binatia bacterium]
MHRIPVATLAVAVCSPTAVLGTVLTLDGALERARREAPAVLAARLRPDEGRGRLAGASVLLRENPVVEGAGGRRDSDRGVSTDIDTGISQTFELGGQRRWRVSGAQAEVESRTADAADTERRVLSEVAAAFLRAIAAEDRVRVLRANDEIAIDLLHVAERRHEAGDIADLELNVARVAASRAHADVRTAEAAREHAVADVKVALGFDAGEPLELRGDLRPRPGRPLDDLLVAAAERPDLRALAADVREAEAEARLGERFRWPDLGVRLGYKREEGADTPMAGVSVALPVFANGQEQRITGAARARRLRLELEARKRAIEVEVRAGFEAHRRLADGVGDLERRAIPVLDDSDSLTRRSWEAGELSLVDYLLVRRETVGARLDYVERSLEAALAAVELEARSGVLE